MDQLVTVVRLGHNFGQTSALAAGFAQTAGKYVIAMDGDLQHDPEDIPVFLHKLSEGYDIVSGWRKQRIDNFWLRRFPSRCANWLMAKLSAVDIHDFGTTFKAYRREVLERLPLYGEMHRFIPALASAYGASICEVPIHNVNRQRGKSHYGISRTFRVLFDLMTIRFLLQYKARPLHFFGRFGCVNIMIGLGVAFWLLIEKVAYHISVIGEHGAAVVFGAVMILAGLQLLAFGATAWHFACRRTREGSRRDGLCMLRVRACALPRGLLRTNCSRTQSEAAHATGTVGRGLDSIEPEHALAGPSFRREESGRNQRPQLQHETNALKDFRGSRRNEESI
ncbi:MAG: glycosyltransferase family 2 protein [Terriglobales bacterium]